MTKHDVAILDVYSPPNGEKRIYLFPRIFGGTEYDQFQTQLMMSSIKKKYSPVYSHYYTTVSYNFVDIFKANGNRFTVHDVVNFLNTPSKERSLLAKLLIEDIFKKNLMAGIT